MEETAKKNGAILLIVSIVLTVVLYLVGIYLKRTFGSINQSYVGCVMLLALVIPGVFLLLSVLLKRRKARSYQEAKVGEVFNSIQERRQKAEKTDEPYRNYRKYRYLALFTAIVVVLCAGSLAVASGIFEVRFISILAFCAAPVLFTISLPRLYTYKVPDASESDFGALIPTDLAPHLYEATSEEAEIMGLREKILITASFDGSLGICKVGKSIVLICGLYLLSILNEEEYRAILRHEFYHILNEQKDREKRYYIQINAARPLHLHRILESILYGYSDLAYTVEYEMDQFARSVRNEAEADRAMSEADPRCAASALVKTAYYDKFFYERADVNTGDIFREEEPVRNELSLGIEKFKKKISTNSSFWNQLIRKEIVSRSATHPTVKMRLDALGIQEIGTLAVQENMPFSNEVVQICSYFDDLFYKDRQEDYQSKREERYLFYLNLINKWREHGEPITDVGYADVLESMQVIGLYEEANSLADRVIKELPEVSSSYAYLIRGDNMLHQYNDQGIDYLYTALERDKNDLEFALSEIGEYCCITGNAEELEKYRSCVVSLLQEQRDVYDERGELRRTDKLSAEELPEGMLEKDLTTILALQNGEINQIYLIHKTITDEFSVSVYIIRFAEGISEDRRHEIMHGIFAYLDKTTSWQYALFDYQNVKDVGFDRIEGTLVYQKK